MAKWWKL